MSINRWMDTEDVVHIYNGIVLSHKKEQNWVICSDVDEPRVCHTKWSQKECIYLIYEGISSVQFSHSVMSNSLWPHEPQHARPPCPSPTPESTQTHVHWVGDVIQPYHPLSSPSPPALNLSQHQGLFKWVSCSHQVAKYRSFSFNISPSNEHPGLISFKMDWLDIKVYIWNIGK